ncbi:MAG: succinylglutamate desuccinylase [Deltaproteobacteria bacterium]|nr:succinylglutamate desuccinylase [Deltaproteobacteria bacterium]MBI4796189.1 succinylglutamate desuccinylase [Deltaproteobacteria bacterium]
MKRTVILALLAVAFVVLFSSGAMAAKLICISNQDIKGEMSVNKCLAQGMEFAIMDDNGFVRILTPREIELTRKLNPKAFEMPGFGLKHHRLAPKIPPLPVSPEVLG